MLMKSNKKKQTVFEIENGKLESDDHYNDPTAYKGEPHKSTK